VTQHVLYGPWGNVEAVSGDSLPVTRLGWKGLVWEGGTAQLYYVRSRWYDPQSGSFLSEDPLGSVAGGIPMPTPTMIPSTDGIRAG
jgi:RHS repeat-associated protein